MERTHRPEQTDLVRCLDCKTIYPRPLADENAGPCPTCGYVGWIALKAAETSSERKS